MAFITSLAIADRLPCDYNIGLVDDMLLQVQADLESLGLVFTAPAETTKTFGNNFKQRIFDFVGKDITSVKISDIHGDSTVDVLSTDYTLSSHLNIPTYISRLELDCAIREYERLQITAKFGLFIDFTSNDYPSKLLKAIIVRFILKNLEFESTAYMSIIESRTGDSMTKYDKSKFGDYYPQIIQDPEFKGQLSYFL